MCLCKINKASRNRIVQPTFIINMNLPFINTYTGNEIMLDHKKNNIENLFCDHEDQTVSAIRIKDYLHWAANPKLYPLSLAMPPIQRGFVWKPKQLQDLWDSLLRGMPIGSILLKESAKGDPNAELPAVNRTVEKASKSGFQLMDGQQRTLAMLLGFPSQNKAQHKLWIDFSEDGRNGSQFQFRVSTEAQPFGFSADGVRLSLDERQKARISWENNDELKKKKTSKDIFNDVTTRPWKTGANKQEYLFEVKDLWQLLEETDWAITIKNKINKEDVNEEILVARIKAFGIALAGLQKQWLALIKIPEIKKQEPLLDPSHDYLTMLFDRISSNGTRLTPNDLLFSMIKQSWPEAHNIVYELHKIVGSLMKPTDFVMTAFRLATLQSDKIKSDPELNAKTFHRHLVDLLGTEDSPKILREMMGENGSLVEAFNKLIKIIKFSDDNNHGIPSALFPYMNESMLQVILYWLIRQENSDALYESRDEIVRFVLFWFVCSKDAKSSYEASKVAIKIISSNSDHLFPGELIYQALTSKDDDNRSLFYALIASAEREIIGDKFRDQNKRSTYYFGESNVDLYNSFTSRIGLLLWFQRRWVEQEYSATDFNPMAGQDADNVPYDFDHLVPQSNWSSLAHKEYGNIKSPESKKAFENLYHRRALGNSIGNYRVMDSSKNRSRGNKPLENEFLQETHQGECSDYAFSVSEIELDYWRKASPGNEDWWKWCDTRLIAFQYAVESRVLNLYNAYYNNLGFSKWLINMPDVNK